MLKNTYVVKFFRFTDAIVTKKRNDIVIKIKENLNFIDCKSILDVGTTDDSILKSSNFIIYKFKSIGIKKSISDQDIKDKFFDINYKKSITENLSEEELKLLSSDIVISSATIEHVGNDKNKIIMIKNISLLARKTFIITTPNRFYPIDFHTKIPLIHFLPKRIHRLILKLLGMKFFSKEENLDLISYNQLKFLLRDINTFEIKIKKIKFLGLTSNFVVIAKKIS